MTYCSNINPNFKIVFFIIIISGTTDLLICLWLPECHGQFYPLSSVSSFKFLHKQWCTSNAEATMVLWPELLLKTKDARKSLLFSELIKLFQSPFFDYTSEKASFSSKIIFFCFNPFCVCMVFVKIAIGIGMSLLK